MKDTRTWSNGFGLPEMLLVILIVLIAGSISVYVYHQDHEVTKRVMSNQNRTSTVTNPYAGWKSYTSSEAGYILKYPSTWDLRSSTNNGGAEDTLITSPDNFQIEALSFTKTSAYWQQPGSSQSCGSSCLAVNQSTSIVTPGLGTLDIDATTGGAGGGTINQLLLIPSVSDTLIASPTKPGVFSTFQGVLQNLSPSQQSILTPSQFLASPDVRSAELMYKSLSY